MEKNLNYIPEITTAECFSCKEEFSLYKVQKVGMNFCALCGINNLYSDLITLPYVLVRIVKHAETLGEKIDGRLVVDVSKLLKLLQDERLAHAK